MQFTGSSMATIMWFTGPLSLYQQAAGKLWQIVNKIVE